MKLQTLTGFEKHMKITRRPRFLAVMASIVPRLEKSGVVESVYPKVGGLRRFSS
jgi:hypothetical protein